jgi:hypothetical protein
VILQRMAEPTLRSALLYVGQSPRLTDADRAQLKRWLAEVKNPVWEKIASDISSHGELPNFVEGPYSAFILYALRARAYATGSPSTYLQRKWKQHEWQQERADLLALADELDRVTRLYRDCKPAQAPRRPPPPDDILPAPPSALELWELEAKRSLDWLSSEAQRLRRLAVLEPGSELDWGLGRIPERISRQSGGRGKHPQSRQLGTFIRKMVNWFYEFCGRPHHRAVAVMTNIAFPTANVDADYVGSLCQPTTRAERRRKTGTPR